MTGNLDPFPQTGIHRHVREFINGLGDLTGKKVLDCPAGDGRVSHVLKQKGAEVVALDLYPEFFKVDGLTCQHGDLAEKLNFSDETFDFVICQEGIEHMTDQLKVIGEFNRVLKPDGHLLLTTPNMSQLRARLSFFLLETDYWKRLPPSEVDSVWFTNKDDDRMYYGHVFLLNILKLRALWVFGGFSLEKHFKTDISATAFLLFIPVYPFLVITSYLAKMFSLSKIGNNHIAWKKSVFKELIGLNCSPKSLLCKHIMVLLKKEKSLTKTIRTLKSLTRDDVQN